MSFDLMLQHSVDVYISDTTAESGTGGRVENHTAVRALAVPCMIGSTSSAEREQWSQENIVASYKVAFAGTGSGIQRGDVLLWTATTGLVVTLRVTGLEYVPGMGGIDDFLYVYAGQIHS